MPRRPRENRSAALGLARLRRAMTRRERICVGLISGTSADAIEAAVCLVRGTHASARLRLLAHSTDPIPKPLASRIRAVRSVRELCVLDALLGERFASAARRAIAQAGLTLAQVDVIGSHGQTVCHLPRPLAPLPTTLQIGQAAIIAERTGIPVVSDFRVRDMACGGEGAPLVPYFDWVAFRKPGVHRALLNIGGIANVSVVGQRLEDTLAFDTGPGNMLLDAIAARATRGRLGFDRDGSLSGRGTVLPGALRELLAHPFLRRAPPRSTGREQFGAELAEALWRRHQRRPWDLMATLAAFTVEATARALERWVLASHRVEGMYVSGGGCRNPSLMEGLARRFAPLPVRTLDALGFPEGAKEAACFALLASEWLAGCAQNVPRATGARRRVLLGKMTP